MFAFVRSVPLLLLFVLLVGLLPVFTQSEAITLEVGKPVERELKGGESHTYRLPMTSGQYLYVVTDQRGIDVVVSLYSPDGKKLVEVDSPNGTKGEEPLRFISETDGDYRLEIRSLEKKASAGRYEVKIAEMRNSTAKDFPRIKAKEALAEGNRLRSQGSKESFGKAIEKFQEAVKLYQEADDISGEGRSLSNIGSVYEDLHQYELALEFQQRSLKVLEKTDDRPSLVLVLRLIAQLYQTLGNYTEAIEVYQQALKQYEMLGNKRQIGNVLRNIGIYYGKQGNYVQALRYAQRGLDVANELGNKGMIASSLINVGVIYSRQRNFELALDRYQKALVLFQEIGARDGINAALNNIGVYYEQQNDLPKALEYYQKSDSRNSIALIRFQQGENNKALEYFQNEIALRQTQIIEDPGGLAELLIDVSEIYAANGDYARAIENIERACEMLRQANQHDILWGTLTELGKYYENTNQNDKAQVAFEEAITEIENMRALIAGGEQQEQGFLGNKISPYAEMVKLLLSKGDIGRALVFGEQTKSHTLLNTLRNGRTDLSKTMSLRERDQERHFKNELVSINDQISSETNKTHLADLQTQLQKKRLEFEEFQVQLYSAHPKLPVQRGEMKPITLDETGSLMPDNKTAVVEFVVAEDKTFLFVVTKDAAKKVSLKAVTVDINDKELGKRVEDYRSKLASGDLDFQKASRELYDLLLKQAQTQLAGKTNLIIVPDGPLWDLPFQALQNAKNQYLAEQAAISYAPSLTALKEMSKKAKARKPDAGMELVAFGNPIVAKTTSDRIKQVFMSEKLEPLPESERLVNELGKMYGANRSKVYVGDQAREETAKTEAPKYRIVQFATHGILNNISPMYSHLVLAQNQENPNEDGLLEAWEMKDLDLKADMVILSACDTARGKISNGEGVIGMSWAMFIAGTPTTVASQWKVESSSTTELMLEFHRQLLAGRTSKAEALRRAELKLLHNPKYSHPSYWGGWVLVGNGS